MAIDPAAFDPFAPSQPVAVPAGLDALRRRTGPAAPDTTDLAAGLEALAAQRRAEEAAGYGQTRRAWNQGLAQLSATPTAVRGLYRNLTGPEGSGDRFLRQSQQLTDEAAEYAPDVQELSDVNGVGDALAYARNTLVTQAPTLVPTLAAAAATGGVGALVSGGGRLAAGQAVKQGVRAGLARAITPTRAAAAGAYAPAAALQANQMVPAALDRTQGGTARERAAKAAAGAFVTAAIETLPTVKLLERFGLGGQIKRGVGASLARRVTTNAAGQAGLEGTTEAVQTFGEKLTHKWVNDNVDVLGPDALADYANAFVAGGLVGGTLGAAAGVRNPDAVKDEIKKVERQLFQGTRPADEVEDIARGAKPGAGGVAPAQDFKNAAETVDAIQDGRPAPAPAAPAAKPKAAEGAMGPADTVTDVKATFDKVMRDLDVEDEFDADFEREYTNFNTWFDSQLSLNTPALDKERNPITGMETDAPVYDQINAGVDAGGVTRGPIPSRPLFDPAAARARQEASKEGGKLGMTAPQALAASVLSNEQISGMSRDAIKAAGVYLTTGDYDKAPNKKALNEFLRALPKGQRIQLHYVAKAWADKVAAARESGITEPLTIDSLVAPNDPKAAPVTAQDVPELNEAATPDVSEIAQLVPNDVIRKVTQAADRVEGTPEQRTAAGFINATNSRGKPQAIKLASIVANLRNTEGVGQLFRRGDAGVVDAVVTALSVLQQKGLEVDIDSIRPGLWLGQPKKSVDPIRLTPLQAREIRNGWNTNRRSRPVVETPGMPGPATTDRLELQPQDDRTPGGAIDRTPSTALGPGRVPQPLRVGPEGQLTEAQATDAEALEDTSELRRDYERVFNRAVGALADTRAGAALVKGIRDLKSPTRGRTPKVINDIVQNLFSERPGMRDSPLGRAYQAAWRNLEEFVTKEDDSEVADAPEVARGEPKAPFKRKAKKFGTVLGLKPTEKPGPTTPSNQGKLVRRDQDIGDAAENSSNARNPAYFEAFFAALDAKLGLKDTDVRVKSTKNGFGSYNPKTQTISLAFNKRNGAALIDTALHEYGHHIISQTWASLPADIKKAVLKDYVKWRREARGRTSFESVRASRAPAFIKKWIADRVAEKGVTPYSKLTPAQRRESLSAHEYMADQLARAMGANAETQGVVAGFFKRLGAMFKALYDAVTTDAYKPAPSAEAWVQHLLQTESARVVNGAETLIEQHALVDGAMPGTPVSPPPMTPGQAAKPSNGGDRPSSLFYALGQEDRGTMVRVLRSLNVYQQIYNQAPQDIKDRLDRYGYDMVTLVDYGAALFAEGKLKIGTDLRSPMRRLIDLFKLAVGLPTDRAAAELILKDYTNGNVKGRNGKRYDATARAFRGYTDTEGNFKKPGQLARYVNGFNKAVENTLGPLYTKLVTDSGTRLRESNVPALARLAALLEPRSGEKTADGGFLQGVDQRWQKMMAPYFKIVEGLDEKEKSIVNRALQRGRPPKKAKLAKAYEQLSALFNNDLYAQAQAGGVAFPKRKDYWPVIIDPRAVARDRDGFKELLSNPKFEARIREFFGKPNSKGIVTADTETKLDVLIDQMTLIAETADMSHVGEVDFTDGVIAPAFAPARRRIMGFIQELGDMGERASFAKYQQRSMDAVVVRYTRSLAKRIEFKTRFIGTRVDPVTKKDVPFNRMEDLLERAAKEGATKDDIAQARDLVNMAVGSYKAELNPAIKWAFSKWDALAGTHLADMSIEKWGSVQQGWMTYQNLRLLPLAAFSSFIDPLGVYTRGGANAGAAWKSYREALSAMRKNNPTQLRAMAESMGIVESHALSDALAATYGGSFDPSGVAGRINNALFKYNGLEAITRYSRLAALAMGHRFLREHGGPNPTAHSVRLLQELGLEASDIKPDPQNANFVVMTPKVQKALYRFVEESVIRPKPTQRPNWHNDPNFMFASQYKGYLYSFWNTVPKRMFNELDAGNTSVALMPLLPYIGVTLAAEVLRDMVQDDEYKKEDWGPGDYATHALVRTGALGPRFGVFNDVKSDGEHGSSVLNSWIGPTGQQISQVTSALLGQRNLKNTAVEALPGSVVFEDWVRE